MKAIKLPVRAYQLGIRPLWNVRDANNVRLAIDLDEAHAKQIALTLNLHGDLVAELKSVRDGIIHRNKIINLISLAEGRAP